MKLKTIAMCVLLLALLIACLLLGGAELNYPYKY